MDDATLRARILYENDDFFVMAKPAGLLVHPVAADSVALTQFLPLLGDGVRLCHRLDRDTSGCLLLARHEGAAKQAGRWFMSGRVGKHYLALVSPAPKNESGEITLPLKKINARMRPAEDGQTALTEWSVLRRSDDQALLALSPKTGRTHQLRAHLSAMGWPIIGDVLYDGVPAARLMLHAAQLSLPGLPIITAPAPFSLDTAMTALEPTPATMTNPVLRYVLATRPAFLSAAAIAVLIGVATAAHDGITLNLPLALITLILAVMAHASANVLNDYYDELNGTDRLNRERIYPFTGGSRFIQNGILSARQTLVYGLILLGLTCIGGLALLTVTGPNLLWLGVPGCLIGWAYSAPPLRLNSRGLGEFCITFCFTLIVIGADLVQRQSLSATPLFAALGYTLLATNILYINQFPDAQADALAGKNHWVVRLGLGRAPLGYMLLASLAYGFIIVCALSGALPKLTLIACLPLPLSLLAARQLHQNATTPTQLKSAIKLTILASTLSGVLMACALVLS